MFMAQEQKKSFSFVLIRSKENTEQVHSNSMSKILTEVFPVLNKSADQIPSYNHSFSVADLLILRKMKMRMFLISKLGT